ncbi:MAG: FAD-dependent oxidoreductase, partial [Akkermansiaceae bacterium]|nr:FAD-dependent oxidoreductase [Akkermansiaceae bacterium]
MNSLNNRPNRHVIIVGAGPGGLTSAMILAHRGFRVTVVEKAPRVGGRSAELRTGAYSHDTGPTFLHQKFTLNEMFAEAGRSLDDELEMVLLDPSDDSSELGGHQPRDHLQSHPDGAGNRAGLSGGKPGFSPFHERPRGETEGALSLPAALLRPAQFDGEPRPLPGPSPRCHRRLRLLHPR